MLTLTRKVGEMIHVGDDIVIVVKEIRRNQVRIGIEAPRELNIYRPEAKESVEKEADTIEEEVVKVPRRTRKYRPNH